MRISCFALLLPSIVLGGKAQEGEATTIMNNVASDEPLVESSAAGEEDHYGAYACPTKEEICLVDEQGAGPRGAVPLVGEEGNRWVMSFYLRSPWLYPAPAQYSSYTTTSQEDEVGGLQQPSSVGAVSGNLAVDLGPRNSGSDNIFVAQVAVSGCKAIQKECYLSRGMDEMNNKNDSGMALAANGAANRIPPCDSPDIQCAMHSRKDRMDEASASEVSCDCSATTTTAAEDADRSITSPQMLMDHDDRRTNGAVEARHLRARHADEEQCTCDCPCPCPHTPAPVPSPLVCPSEDDIWFNYEPCETMYIHLHPPFSVSDPDISVSYSFFGLGNNVPGSNVDMTCSIIPWAHAPGAPSYIFIAHVNKPNCPEVYKRCLVDCSVPGGTRSPTDPPFCGGHSGPMGGSHCPGSGGGRVGGRGGGSGGGAPRPTRGSH